VNDDKDIPLANSKVLYETLLNEEGYAVARTTVRPGGQTQWHRHTHVSDRLMVVRGVLTVETRLGERIERTQVRDHHTVEPGITHHVKNETPDDVVYIMVQSGGTRDIVLV
jgi:beta-alanine degradation protein BauB